MDDYVFPEKTYEVKPVPLESSRVTAGWQRGQGSDTQCGQGMLPCLCPVLTDAAGARPPEVFW